MPRWRQEMQEDGHTRFVPIDDAARKMEGHALHTEFEAFISPVDGSIVDDRKKLREHNLRNNVVSHSEYSPEYIEKMHQKRRDFFDGKRSSAEIRKSKMEMYERFVEAEKSL